jgi:hypothetical protein
MVGTVARETPYSFAKALRLCLLVYPTVIALLLVVLAGLQGASLPVLACGEPQANFRLASPGTSVLHRRDHLARR